LASTLFSQTKLEKVNSLPILTIGKEQITYDQLDRAYQKNISKQKPHLYMLEKDSILDFVNLYTNYRLKVQDALSRGLDKDSAIKAESLQNRRILAESFLFEKEITEPYVNLMTERRKLEFKIAVIFTTFPQVPVRDTATAFSKINEALTQLKSGSDFSEVAQKYCDDESLARKGGVVDQWVTSGKISREIEDAIYSLNSNEFYPQIIATPYGYFLVKVLDKQPRFFVMGGHILYKQFIRPEDSVNVGDLVYPALQRIRKGESFEEIARQESTDKFSGEKGGSFEDLYSRSTGFEKSKGMLDPKFSDMLFSLKDNEVSNVVTTDYGNHIIKRYYRQELDLAKEKEDVRKIYKKQYFETDKINFLEKTAVSMNMNINDQVLNELTSKFDSTQSTFSKNWADSIPSSILPKTLFSISSKNYTVKNFADEMLSNSQLKGFATNNE
jgi:peptidyl-prolyl cis-trans isomerase SurA